MTRHLAILLCFCIAAAAPTAPLAGLDAVPSAKEAEKATVAAVTPNPGSLTKNWWQYFNVDGEKLKERIAAFEEAVKGAAELIEQPDKKREALALVNKAVMSLNSYQQALSRAPPPPPPPTTYQDTYTIGNLLELTRAIRKMSFEIKNDSDLRNERQKGVAILRGNLDKAEKRYLDLPERSNERFFEGLLLIDNKVSLETALLTLQNIEQAIKNDNAQLGYLRDERSFAEGHLTTNQIQISKYRLEQRNSEKRWIQASNALQEREGDDSLTEGSAQEFEGVTQTQLQQQRSLRDESQLAAYHNDFLMAQIKLNLALLLGNPGSVNIKELDLNVERWGALLQEYKTQTAAWLEHTQKLVERSGQALSLIEEERAAADKERQQRLVTEAQQNLLTLQKLEASLGDSLYLWKILDDKVTYQLGGSEWWGIQLVSATKATFAKFKELFSATLFTVGDTNITLMSFFKLLLVLVAAVWISRAAIAALLTLASNRKGLQRSLVYRITRLIQYLVFALAVIVGLMMMGFDFSSLVLLASALSVGIGFGLQSIFNNVISGLIILFANELKVGDFIELETGQRGEIREINLRSTIITTNDNVDILIPNAQMLSNRVVNWTLKDPYRRVHVPFVVAYGSDPALVVNIVKEAAKGAASTLNKVGTPEPKVYMTKLGDNGVEYELLVWVTERATKRVTSTQSEYLFAIEEALRKNNIDIPYPQQEVFFRNNLVIERKDSDKEG